MTPSQNLPVARPSRALSLIVILALAVPLVALPMAPAQAAHFIAVEPRVDITYDRQGQLADGHALTYAVNVRLRLDHRWTSGGTFSPTLTGPDGSTITTTTVPRVEVVSESGSGLGGLGLQIIDYDFSSVALTAGVYRLAASSCCDKAFVNGTSSGGMSFEVGFWFDSGDRPASQGSPRFNSALITNIAGGSTFTQNLGGQSVNAGGSVTLAFVEGSASPSNGAPVSVAGLDSGAGGVFQGAPAVDWLRTGLTFTNGDLATLNG